MKIELGHQYDGTNNQSTGRQGKRDIVEERQRERLIFIKKN